MNDAMTCPKCRHPMNRGFMVDRSAELNHVGQWVEGEPERSFFMGLKVPLEKSFPVTTYRCVSCGFLEAYARR